MSTATLAAPGKALFMNRVAATITGNVESVETKYTNSGDQVKSVRIVSLGTTFAFALFGKEAEKFGAPKGASVHLSAQGFQSQEGLPNPSAVIALSKARIHNVMPASASRPEAQSITIVAQIGNFANAVRSDERVANGESKHVTNLKLGLSGKTRDNEKGYVNLETAIWGRPALDQYLTPGSMVMIKNGVLKSAVNADKTGKNHVNMSIAGDIDLIPTGNTESGENAGNAAAASSTDGGAQAFDANEIPF
jgi:hypothetical protein